MSEERFRVAIVGTFDVENYGDLLFPLLAQESLGKRLGELELLIFSYNSKPRGAWPFEVRSLEDLPEALTDVDALLIGGGHLFRFDKQVGVEYGPPSSNIHHPTGYWLVPALLGALSGKPVIWNGIGVSVDTPEWGRTMATTALRASSYVSVRDKPSARELLRLAPEAEIHVIPDTAFGLSELLSREPTEEFLRWRTSIGLQREYVVIQPAPALKPYASVIREALASLSARGVQVVELVIGPAVGDEVGILHLDPPPVTASLWSQPLLLAEVVKGASAVIAQSLHLSITALCVDVPLFRVQSDEGSKYSILESQPGVWMFDGTAGVLAESLGSVLSGRPLGKSMKPELDKLNVHWDRVARIVQEGHDRAVEDHHDAFISLVQDLPHRLERLELDQVELESLKLEIVHLRESFEHARIGWEETVGNLRKVEEDYRETVKTYHRLGSEHHDAMGKLRETASELRAIKDSRSWKTLQVIRRLTGK